MATAAELLLDASLSANTRRAYASDWQQFCAWCEAHALISLPAVPTTLVLYLTELAVVQRRKVATIERCLSAIRKAHRAARLASPNAAHRG